MNLSRTLSILAIASLISAGSVVVQRSTERYITVGQSPGISGKYTTLGKIEAVDTLLRTVTCTYAGGSITVNVDSATRIWVDRSNQKLSSLKGSLGYCKQGQVIEIKFRNNDRHPGAIADWIKVQPLGQ